MPRPILLKIILKTLRQEEFVFISQTGSHAKYRKIGNPTLNTIVPIHGKEVPYRTFRYILRQTKLVENDFKRKYTQKKSLKNMNMVTPFRDL